MKYFKHMVRREDKPHPQAIRAEFREYVQLYLISAVPGGRVF
jgi:hypothetical protein